MAKKGNKDSAVYKVIEIVGTSNESWSDAGASAVKTASRTIRDLRVAEVGQMDMKIDGGKIIYRVKLKVSFKFHGED
jgi:hypothetical protein